MEVKHVTREEMAEIDRRAIEEYGIPAAALMENAGRAVADEVAKLGAARIAVVCGKGHNGGDGFVCARWLHNRGAVVRVITVGADEPEVLRRMRVRVEPFAGAIGECELVVDALLGTGLRGPVREPHRAAIEAINAAGRPVVAVDIPSGLDANTGDPLGAAVRATRTVTMGLPKIGFTRPGASAYAWEVVVADFGFPRDLIA